jgi:hypothetical protein
MVTISEILDRLEPSQKEITQNLRALIKITVPEAVEIVRQEKIAYRLSDKDFVWIDHYQGHVDLEFFMGASISSPMLKTRGGVENSDKVRHVEVKVFDAQKPELVRLLKTAATVGFEHCPSKP